MTPAASVPGSRRYSPGGGPVPLLLPAPGPPRLRPAGAGQPDRLRSLRPDPAVPPALSPHPQGPLLRAQGHAAVPSRPARREGPRADRAPRRADRRAGHGAVDRGEPQHGGPLQPTAGRSRPGPPRRARGLLPLGRTRSSSMRNGPTSTRSRSTATPAIRPMTGGGMGGTTRPTTPSTSGSSAPSPGRGAPRRPRRGSPTSGGGRRAGP